MAVNSLPEEELAPEHKPYVPPEQTMPEFTWQAVALGALLGIVFGASSLYLLLKVGMTVSASVPIAVLSITLFRAFSRWFGFRRATILENNVVQTTGSAGESIAFGVGVTMPALLLLGFEMSVTRVMTVSVLGGLLGILMMIPLRRAFIVKQHGKLIYPEGTACAEVLVAGEKGGASARMVFLGFGIAAMHKFITGGFRLWAEQPSQNLYSVASDGTRSGLKGTQVQGELVPELLGVGFLIGPRIACMMMAGAFLSYYVLASAITEFGQHADRPVLPATSKLDEKSGEDKGLIRNMSPDELRGSYLRYIGAGAVAAGGIISMLRALPLILGSILSGLRDLRATRAGGESARVRTERDLPMNVVLYGSLGLVLVLMAIPELGLGLSLWGLLGGVMILLFGFLFVTVSSRLTGEVGSSSNPISGMTIATLLMTCMIFWALGRTMDVDQFVPLTALMIAGVVCIASSNGGTTSQDLKTGFLVGATPQKQQWAILIGALTSALVIGLTMLLLNAAGTHYTTRDLPAQILVVPSDATREQPGKPYADDTNSYRIVHVRKNDPDNPGVKPGRYLVDDSSRAKYRTDMPIQRELKTMDSRNPEKAEGPDAPKAFSAPQPELFATITRGILGGELEWGLVIIGALIAVTLELAGVRALPVAVGMYIGLGTTTAIFIGGLLRWLADKARGVSASESETETSPGVLLASGYIAGGTLVGLILAFFAFSDELVEALDLGRLLPRDYHADAGRIVALIAFAVLALILYQVGRQRPPDLNGGDMPPVDPHAFTSGERGRRP
jgi:putative OPT family oligopeptide transporter